MTTDRTTPFDEHYTPDPDRDMTLLIDRFFAEFPDRPEMRRTHEELIGANQDLVVDEPARHNLRLTLALVAAYQHLEPELGRAAALTAVEAAFVEPCAREIRQGTRAMLDAAEDPFEAMVSMSRTRELTAFGAGFRFSHPVDNQDEHVSDVRQCFYQDVLARTGATALATVLCAFDNSWISAIEPRHGFVFELETTIGRGGGHCPFHFRRTTG